MLSTRDELLAVHDLVAAGYDSDDDDGSVQCQRRVLELATAEHLPSVLDIFRWECAEISPGDLGAMHVYAGAAMMAQPGSVVIDFGCYSGIQAALFGHVAEYIGVDSSPVPRFHDGSPGIRHYMMSAQQWVAEHGDRYWGDEVLAICSYLPDSDARAMVRRRFGQVIDIYPAHPIGGWHTPTRRLA